ncbi:MAG: chromate transporter [Tenericutes bacterium]|nr:chromate transporter [Mycoplasmatota bacterium]
MLSLLFKLFITFLKIGLFTFGGGYAMIPLITQEVFNNAWVENTDILIDWIAIAESTPGPFAVNIATFIGYEQAGIIGAIAATLGVMVPSFVIILMIAKAFSKFSTNIYVRGFLKGVRPVVPGIILSVGIMFILKYVFEVENFQFGNFNIEIKSLIIFTVIFVLSRLWKKAHPVYLVAIAGVLGILLFGVI